MTKQQLMAILNFNQPQNVPNEQSVQLKRTKDVLVNAKLKLQQNLTQIIKNMNILDNVIKIIDEAIFEQETKEVVLYSVIGRPKSPVYRRKSS